MEPRENQPSNHEAPLKEKINIQLLIPGRFVKRGPGVPLTWIFQIHFEHVTNRRVVGPPVHTGDHVLELTVWHPLKITIGQWFGHGEWILEEKILICDSVFPPAFGFRIFPPEH